MKKDKYYEKNYKKQPPQLNRKLETESDFIEMYKKRETFLPYQVRIAQLIHYMDDIRPNGFEQLVVFMCWFSPKLGKDKTTTVIRCCQELRNQEENINMKRIKAVSLFHTHFLHNTDICNMLDISTATLYRWVKEADKQNFKTLSFSDEEYELLMVFMDEFDKLCRARNIIWRCLDE